MKTEPGLVSHIEGWALLRKFRSPVRAALMKAVLEEQYIPAIVLNKRDTAYDLFGYAELYVPDHFVTLATIALDQEGSPEDFPPSPTLEDE